MRSHPDLDIASHGLTLWDLDREWPTGGFGGKEMLPLRNILGVLRDSYCRSTGIEYMHIQSPEERQWFQDEIEHPYEKPSRDEQFRILGRLNAAEAFETFLQTKFVGQKRFSLEGGESLIPLLDVLLSEAADEGLDEVAIGIAHRGRLNVLTNIAGKTYAQVFREFEGREAGTGSGDVKYHLDPRRVHLGPRQLDQRLPGRQPLPPGGGEPGARRRGPRDAGPPGPGSDSLNSFSVMPLLIHGDAAFAGQGVVAETLNLSQLRGYRTGGTVHVVVNNQVGFTTAPSSARSMTYSTDMAKAIQAPIFHVNADDPESVARVAQLAFRYRQRFNKDVVIDLVCYRRRGHNEGDDPSMTQPKMYNLVEAKRTTRRLYTEALVGRGDITQEEADQALQDYRQRLERVFTETHAAQTQPVSTVEASGGRGDVAPTASEEEETTPERSPEDTAISEDKLAHIGEVHTNIPELHSTPEAEVPAGEACQDVPRGRHRLGLRRDRRLRLAAHGGHRGAHGRTGFPPRHLRAAPRGLPRPGQRRRVVPAEEPDRGPGPVLHLRLAALRVRGPGLRVRLLGGEPERLVLWEAQFGDFVNGARSSSMSSSPPPSRSGASVPAWSCSCPTAMRARARTIPPDARSGSCSSAQRTT